MKQFTKQIIKRAILSGILLLCALLLGGCVPLAIDMQRADEFSSLPVPAAQQLEAAIGDVQIATEKTISLYVVSDDHQLVPVERIIRTEREDSDVKEAVRLLLSMDAPVGALLPFPEGTRLLNIQQSGGAVIVELSIEARNVQNPQQLLWMRSSIAATLLALPGVNSVSVLFAGQDEGMLSLPSGAVSHVRSDLSAAWAQLCAEAELFEADNSASIERSAIIYYPTRDGRYIAPVMCTVRLSGNDFVTPLIQAMMNPPQNMDNCLRSPFPRGESILTQPPEIINTPDNERFVQLSFDANLIAMLEREGLSEWQLYAALTHTITGFVPETDGLIISLGDGLLMRTGRNGEELSFFQGRMTRASYPDAVCSLCAAYMGASDGALMRVMRPLTQTTAAFAVARLRLLFDGPQPWEENASRIMPDGVTADDLLGVRIASGEAVVNLSSNFYRCAQSLSARQERVLIYAMVNTLTELSGVHAVRFQIEGETVDSLTGTIFLRGALMKNTGIICGEAH